LKGYIPEDKIEEVRNRIDIVSLVSEFVTLKKTGRNFTGLCPFHQEKTPSFSVNPDKQIFHCFGCGEGGNVISFLMKINEMTFPEAVRHLAGKSGVVIPERVMTARDKEEIGIREQISRINEQAAALYAKNLFSATGQAARTYLKSRGIGEAVVREFRLGFAAEAWRHLRDHFEKQKASLEVLEKGGLLIAGKDGGLYDRFRGRVMFPIEDINGRVIAFGGRVLGEGEPKYLNSPETPLYVKGRHLYGLNRTREDIRKQGYAILVEGYVDLIALWNGGVKNVVASLGTALTADQVQLIKRYTMQVVVLFDPDEAGKKALARSLPLFLAGGIHAKAAVLPAGYDPDAFIRAFGPEEFENIITKARSMVDYYIENIIGHKGSATLEDTYDALREAIPFLAGIDDAIERNLFIKRVAEKLGIEQELLKAQVNPATTKSKKTPAVPKAVKPIHHIDAVEFALIQAMIEWPAKISMITTTYVLDYFLSEDLKDIAEDIRDAVENGKTVEASFIMDRIGDQAMREKLLESMMKDNIKDGTLIDRYIQDTVRQIKKKWYRDKKRILQTEIIRAQENGDQELCNRLSTEKAALSKQENAL
jgi:DNA primase